MSFEKIMQVNTVYNPQYIYLNKFLNLFRSYGVHMNLPQAFIHLL